MDDGSREAWGAWYDDKQGETGDPWHRTLIDPGLFTQLGRLAPGTRVLDLGCGNGYIARRLAREGCRVVGVDASRELLARARASERSAPLGVVYRELDAAHLDGIADASFDVAIANMSLIDIEDAAGALREAGRAVVDGGRLVFTISHPCFDVDTRSAWLIETASAAPVIFRKVTGYRLPHRDRYPWAIGADRTVETVGYHRPLGWYAHELRMGGWVIVDLAEPAPLPDFVGHRVKKEWIEEIPLHLVVDARREPRTRRPERPLHRRVAAKPPRSGPRVIRPARYAGRGRPR